MRIILLLIIVICLSACSSGPAIYAPVTNVATIEAIPKSGVYRVRRNDTLYSIAWRYGLDYRYLAKRNHIIPPYLVRVDQTLYLRGYPKASFISQKARTVTLIEREPTMAVSRWLWPAQGRLVGEFSGLNKGINITGRLHDPIVASAAGKVVYSGNGLRGYGNLIIIKHNSMMLSAYAHNEIVWVKEGDFVAAGQKIADMGYAEGKGARLHFEIRRNGQPVNPLNYLANR